MALIPNWDQGIQGRCTAKKCHLTYQALLGNKGLILLRIPFTILPMKRYCACSIISKKELTLVVSAPELNNRVKQMFDQVITLNNG